MQLRTNSQTTFKLTVPEADIAQQTTTGTTSSEEQVGLPLSDNVINSFGEGTHHDSPILPTENTILPPVEDLRQGLFSLHEYLSTAGGAVIADAQLQGLAAVVTEDRSGGVYAYLDKDLFKSLVEQVLDRADILPTTSTDQENLIEAIIAVHGMEFSLHTQENNIPPQENADWPTGTGQQTNRSTGLVFTTPHPVTELDEYPVLPERGIALTAGMQHLATDLDESFKQSDIALAYLPAYLRAHGLTPPQAIALVADWYDVSEECARSVETEITRHAVTSGLPARDPEFRYYLTGDAFNEFMTQ